MNFNWKIHSGALQFTILISIVIVCLLSVFSLLAYSHLKLNSRITESIRILELSRNGINYALSNNLAYDTPTNVYFESKEQFQVLRSHWGIYDCINSSASNKHYKNESIALIGGKYSNGDMRPALKLENTRSSLKLNNTARIYGDIYMSKEGVVKGAVRNNYYSGGQLLYGNLINDPSIPKMEKTKIDYLISISTAGSSSVPFQNRESLNVSFASTPHILFQEDPIHILKGSYSGNIIIKSTSSIRISAFAKAKNILLIAPQIIIDDNFSGTLQAIATENITVGENVRLTYPSALLNLKLNELSDDYELTRSLISLGNQSVVQGSIICLDLLNNKKSESHPAVSIAEKALVQGEIYSHKSIELRGLVEGSVYSHAFLANRDGTLYQNSIFEGVINSSELPNTFCGISSEETIPMVLKWLN